MRDRRPKAQDSGETLNGGYPYRMVKRDQILAFLKTHPAWYLEHCEGSTMSSHWWWVRNSKRTCDVIKCNGNAAMACLSKLTRWADKDGKWGVAPNAEVSRSHE